MVSTLFKKTLGNGGDFGAAIDYAVQDSPNGIAQAISIGKDFIGSDGFCLITGDTIIEGENVTDKIKTAIRTSYKSGNATIFVEGKTYPDQYGKVILDNKGKAIKVIGDG